MRKLPTLEDICWWLLGNFDFTRWWVPYCILAWVWDHAGLDRE